MSDDGALPYEGGRDDDGRRHGQGVANYPNGDAYTGTYVHGQREGRGTYAFKNGASYCGGYSQNKKYGAGKMNYPDGSIFEGEWKNDKRDGLGSYTYKNGDKYNGGWKRGERSGKGVYFFKDQQCQFFGAAHPNQRYLVPRHFSHPACCVLQASGAAAPSDEAGTVILPHLALNYMEGPYE
jgi:radial spoke head protein 1